MEIALTTPVAIDLLNAEPKLMVALLAILILVGGFSRQLFSFLGSSLLAVLAFSIFESPGSLPIVLILGCAAGSVLVSIAGMHQRRQLDSLRRELTRCSLIQTRLETAESRRVLADIRSTHFTGSRPAVIDSVEVGSNGRGSPDVDTHVTALAALDLTQSA
jgi:hypothetical protein